MMRMRSLNGEEQREVSRARLNIVSKQMYDDHVRYLKTASNLGGWPTPRAKAFISAFLK